MKNDADMDFLDRIERITGSAPGTYVPNRAKRSRHEREIKNHNREMKAAKRRETIRRASKPRFKHDRKRTGRDNSKLSYKLALPSIAGKHESLMKELDGSELMYYTRNYNNYLVHRDCAMEMARQKDGADESKQKQLQKAQDLLNLKLTHRRAMQATFKRLATQVPHEPTNLLANEGSSDAELGGPGRVGILSYFVTKTNHHCRKTELTWKRFYFNKVILALDYDIEDWRTEDERNKAVKDFQMPAKEKPKVGTDPLCGACGGVLYLDTVAAHFACTQCGLVTEGGDGVRFKASFSEQQSTQRGAAPYDRLAHFKEFIARLEGTERTEIPEIVRNQLLLQCEMHGIDPVKDHHLITYSRTREFLAKIGYPHFFENIPKIMGLLTFRAPQPFTTQQRNELTRCFKMIQEPFERHKGDRKNFLSYSYTIYKLCEYLGYHEFLSKLPLLKAARNLLRADEIWQEICKDCGFTFKATA